MLLFVGGWGWGAWRQTKDGCVVYDHYSQVQSLEVQVQCHVEIDVADSFPRDKLPNTFETFFLENRSGNRYGTPSLRIRWIA